MAEPICEDEGLLQEWTPLTQLLQQIPLKIQRGLFSKNLNLTCVDVVPKFIALGTNLGFLYWYCRATGDLQRLRLENGNSCVTCVKITTFVDYMVAAGTDQGTVIVFQIPKTEPENSIDAKKSKQKQMERFQVNGLHQASVTSVEWDSEEMKVFSGDKNGIVVLTEINLSLHISKSREILNEQFEIVQLSYCQNILLISTVYRSTICDCSNNWKVVQVGTKQRKTLGKFGATFCKFPLGLVIFASRPGHHVWLADKNGTVQQTLIFKSAVQSNCPKIQLINPIDKKEPYDTSFGKIIQFGDSRLVTYNSEIMYILHPGAVGVISVLKGARKILDLAVNENEIFILEEERSLLRIGVFPDEYSLDMLYHPVSRTSFNLDEFAAKLKDTAMESIKKITKDLIPLDKHSPNSPPAVADEAVELPPVVTLPSSFMPQHLEFHSSIPNQNCTSAWNNPCSNKLDEHSSLSANETNNSPSFNQDAYEEIITRPLRKRNKKSKQLPKSKDSLSITKSGSDTTSNLSEDRLVCGVINELSLSDESAFSEGSHSRFSLLRDLSSLLTRQALEANKCEVGIEDVMKTSDAKSQTSLDTVESVSERLLCTPNQILNEQEKAFGGVADHSFFDSSNSENIENMSISVNLTNSSSISSKISENLPSPSYASEYSETASRVKSIESQSMDNFEGRLESPSKTNWRWDNGVVQRNCAQEESTESSVLFRNLQDLYSKLPKVNQDGSFSSNGSVGIPAESPTDKSQASAHKKTYTNSKSCSHLPESSGMNDSCALEYKRNSAPDSNLGDISCSSAFECSERFCQSDNLLSCSKAEKEKEQAEDEDKEFLSNEPLSYGPPSGSSMSSSQPSSDFTSNPNAQISLPLPQDSFDHWLEYKIPKKIRSLAVSNKYVVCTDFKDRVYYSNLSGLGLSWKKLPYRASLVRPSQDGSAGLILRSKKISAMVNPSECSPTCDTILEIFSGTKTFAIDSLHKDALMVTLSEKLVTLNNLMKGLKDNFTLPCDIKIMDVAYSGGVILALDSGGNLLCKLPEENEFKFVNTLKPTISMSLSSENLLWVVDEANQIFFSDDYFNEYPQWWQIQISDYIFQNPSGSFKDSCSKEQSEDDFPANIQPKNSLITTNENSVWVYKIFASTAFVNKSGFTGYMWKEVPSVNALQGFKWETLCARGGFEGKDRVWLLSSDGNIFCTIPDHEYVQSVPVPCEEKILCMVSFADTFWILSENGVIYSRLGLSTVKNSGIRWKEMRSLLIDNLKFVWMSCGTDVAWACDIHGRTFIWIGSQDQMATTDPIWVEVEGRPKDVHFEKVFVGSQVDFVWAIDSNQNLYVREGIFPHYQIGTSWVYVCGIKAVHVTISGANVWALTSNGKIYRRCGVSESNFIGDYWRSIPGKLKMISSSFTDRLWGIGDDNKILRLNSKLKVLNCELIEEAISSNLKSSSSKEDASWEIVQ